MYSLQFDTTSARAHSVISGPRTVGPGLLKRNGVSELTGNDRSSLIRSRKIPRENSEEANFECSKFCLRFDQKISQQTAKHEEEEEDNKTSICFIQQISSTAQSLDSISAAFVAGFSHALPYLIELFPASLSDSSVGALSVRLGRPAVVCLPTLALVSLAVEGCCRSNCFLSQASALSFVLCVCSSCRRVQDRLSCFKSI